MYCKHIYLIQSLWYISFFQNRLSSSSILYIFGMCYLLKRSEGDLNRGGSPRADDNYIRSQGRKTIGQWSSVRGKKRNTLFVEMKNCILVCLARCKIINLICSFFSLSWMFFITNVLVNSLPGSQSSQTSSGLVSSPKKQLLCIDACRWRFPTFGPWWIPGFWKVGHYRRYEFWKLKIQMIY